jgi:hypothetical protein
VKGIETHTGEESRGLERKKKKKKRGVEGLRNELVW